jgi:hypothetical protein
MLSAMSGLLLGVLAAFIRSAMRGIASLPEKAQQIQKLKNVWAWRSQPK